MNFHSFNQLQILQLQETMDQLVLLKLVLLNKMDTMPQWTIYQFATTPLKAKTLWTPTADQVVLECKQKNQINLCAQQKMEMNSALIPVCSQAQDVDLQIVHQVITQLLFILRSNHLVKLTNGLSQQKMLLQHQNQQKN